MPVISAIRRDLVEQLTPQNKQAVKALASRPELF